jgi:hypothetical protein
MDLNETGWEGADWIHPAQYRDRWWALQHTFRHRIWLVEWLSASQEILCSTELVTRQRWYFWISDGEESYVRKIYIRNHKGRQMMKANKKMGWLKEVLMKINR